MRPATALGHVAGKFSVVLYGMLKTMMAYDEDKHRKQLGLVQFSGQPSSTPVDISLDLVDIADAADDLGGTDGQCDLLARLRPKSAADEWTEVKVRCLDCQPLPGGKGDIAWIRPG